MALFRSGGHQSLVRRGQSATAIGALVMSILVLVGCSARVSSTASWRPLSAGEIASHRPVTLEMWGFQTGPEANEVEEVLGRLHRQFPWLTVHYVGGKTDFDMLQGIYSGHPPDIAEVGGPANVARFCATKAMPNLARVASADGVSLTRLIPGPVLKTASFDGSTCMLPWLTDAFGLFYNKDLFAKAHIRRPPRTLAELEADAKRLTTYNPDGSIKTAGFVPLSSFYHSNHMDQGPTFGANWYQANGKSALGTDPRWRAGFTWQKNFIDSIGYDKLNRFAASVGTDSEYTPNNAFEIGRVAMIMDGEWRVGYLNRESKVNYGTAPFPAMTADRYGSGQIGGTMISMPASGHHPAEAWLAIKYLALDTGALNQIADGLQNIPTTYPSLATAKYSRQPENKAFISILKHPDSEWKQPVRAGQVDIDLLTSFATTYEAGNGRNLQDGLDTLARNIDAQVAVG